MLVVFMEGWREKLTFVSVLLQINNESYNIKPTGISFLKVLCVGLEMVPVLAAVVVVVVVVVASVLGWPGWGALRLGGCWD